MILPLLLKALNLAQLADLKSLIAKRRGTIIAKATKALREAGDIEKLNTSGPFAEPDGALLTGNEMYVHNCLYRLAKALGLPGELADKARDVYWSALRPQAEEMLKGAAGGREATARVLDAWVEVVL